MTFDDIPQDWDHNLDHVALTDVIDLFATDRDRQQGVLVVLLADSSHQLLVPMVIDDLPRDPTALSRQDPLHGLGEVLDHLPDITAAALGIGRTGSSRPRRSDLAWQHAFLSLCRRRGTEVLGVCLASSSGVTRLDNDDVAAA